MSACQSCLWLLLAFSLTHRIEAKSPVYGLGFCSEYKRGSVLAFTYVPYIHPVFLPARQIMSLLSQTFQPSTLCKPELVSECQT